MQDEKEHLIHASLKIIYPLPAHLTVKLGYFILFNGLNTLGIFVAMFEKGDNFCHLPFAHLQVKPLLKRLYSKRKEFAPMGKQILSF